MGSRAFNWLTGERKMWLAIMVIAASIGYGLGNGHTTQNSINALVDRLHFYQKGVQHFSEHKEQ